jgi:hypothetical protein
LPIPELPVLLHSQIERRRAWNTGEKEIFRWSWFLQKAPHLCTPPESTGFTASKAHLMSATNVANKVGQSKKFVTFAPRIARTAGYSPPAKRPGKRNFLFCLSGKNFALPLHSQSQERDLRGRKPGC